MRPLGGGAGSELGTLTPAPRGGDLGTALRITDVPGRANPTPKPTDEKGNPKHWVKRRLEQQFGSSNKGMVSPSTNQSLSPPSDERGWLPESGSIRGDVISPSTIHGSVPDVVDEDWLVAHTGIVDLAQLDRLRLIIDTSSTTIEGVGSLLPGLRILDLSSSRIESLRDLGTSLSHLMVLNVSSCNLEGLEGIAALAGLRELYLAHNRISHTTPLAMHDYLKMLDLSYNHLSDVSSLEVLGSCSQLQYLRLTQNPVWTLGSLYRRLAGNAIPQLVELDGRKLSSEERTTMTEDEWTEIQESLNRFESVSRPTAQADAGEPLSKRPEDEEPGTPTTVEYEEYEDEESRLTRGAGFLAGNPTSSIRRRKPTERVWYGTILEVLDNPEKDIAVSSAPPSPAGQDLQTTEAVRGNPMLAELFERRMQQQDVQGELAGVEEETEVYAVGKLPRRAKSESHAPGKGATVFETSHKPPEARRVTISTALEAMPLPVKIDTKLQRCRGKPIAIAKPRRLRRRQSSSSSVAPSSSHGTGSSDRLYRSQSSDTDDDDDDDQEDKDGEEGEEQAVRVLERTRVGSRSDAQKASVRLGFDLCKSLRAIDQWLDEFEDDEYVVSHGTQILHGLPTRGMQRSDVALCTSQAAAADVKSPPRQVRRSLPSVGHGIDRAAGGFRREGRGDSGGGTAAPQASFVGKDGGDFRSGLHCDDLTLVGMLKRPPKQVPQLRTRDSFRDFFRGMPARRMETLLLQAFDDLEAGEAREKVARRMELLRDVLVI